YLPGDTQQIRILKDPTKAYISRYTLGRDYHKLIRKRLSQLAQRIDAALPADFPGKGEVQNRAFVDSAPVMERPLAEKAGLGWTGKHRSEEHTSELQSRENLVCRLLLEKKKRTPDHTMSDVKRLMLNSNQTYLPIVNREKYSLVISYLKKVLCILFYHYYLHPPDLHSFPTRRSSDLLSR